MNDSQLDDLLLPTKAFLDPLTTSAKEGLEIRQPNFLSLSRRMNLTDSKGCEDICGADVIFSKFSAKD